MRFRYSRIASKSNLLQLANDFSGLSVGAGRLGGRWERPVFFFYCVKILLVWFDGHDFSPARLETLHH